MKYMLKGTIIGNNERTEKIYKGKVKEGIYITMKDCIIIPLDNETTVNDVINGIKNDLGAFTPKWVNEYDKYENGVIPYVNLSSSYTSKVVNKTKNTKDEDIIINNSKGIVLCKNTYHNSIAVYVNGKEYDPFIGMNFDFDESEDE